MSCLDRTSGKGQVIITGMVAFCASGMFNALNGLGNAGSADSGLGALSNAVLYFTFSVFGYTGGLWFNWFGPKLLMAVGTSTYSIYGVFAYLASQPDTVSWGGPLFVVAGGLLGIGAGLFWTAQGALTMAYAPDDKKGSYIGMFWVIFNTGGVAGGSLSAILNWGNKSSTASPVSYFVFIAIMCGAVVLSMFFINNPKNVTREDGSPVFLMEARGFKEEITDVAMVITDRNMLLLFVLFFSSNYFYTYVFNSVNGALFTIRTRGFNSASFWAAQMIGSVVFGRVVDRSGGSVNSRAQKGWWLVFLSNFAAYALGFYVQFSFRGGYTYAKEITDDKKLDIVDHTGDWIVPYILVLLYGWGDCVIQTFSYWVMSVKAGNDSNLAARYAGFYKGIQSFGGAISWMMDSNAVKMSSKGQLVTNTALYLVGMGFAYIVVAGITESEVVENEEESHDTKAVATVAAEN